MVWDSVFVLIVTHVGFKFVLALIPVRSVDLDTGKFRPLPTGGYGMMVRINGSQVGNHDFIPPGVRLLFVQKLPEIHVGSPSIHAVLHKSLDFRHSRVIIRLVIEDLLVTEKPVKNAEVVFPGAAEQLIRHDPFLNEIVVQVAIEYIGTVLLRKAV